MADASQNSLYVYDSQNGRRYLKGPLTINCKGETIEADELRFRSKPEFVEGTNSNEIYSGDTIIMENGALSKGEDGSYLIEGNDESPVTIKKVDKGGEHTGLLVEFRGELDETVLEMLAERKQLKSSGLTPATGSPAPSPESSTPPPAGSLEPSSDPSTPPPTESPVANVEIEWDGQQFQILGGKPEKQEDGSLLITAESENGSITIAHLSNPSEQEEQPGFSPWLYGGTLLLAMILSAIVSGFFFARKRKKKEKTNAVSLGRTEMLSLSLGPQQAATSVSVGQCQNIGRRPAQQDSMGAFKVSGGVFTVVADGMGGLRDGDKVSQKIVQTIGEDCRKLTADQIRGNLMALLSHANDEVNRMLGPNDLYKSGSTTVAVLAEPQQFQWVSVGDSRIYLYRGGRLLQLNREHNYEADLLMRAVNHQISFQEAVGNPKRKSVSSFIGMGALKYVDSARRPIRTLKGDRILLCSDGVFNTLTDPMIETILSENPDPSAAAAKLEAAVLQANNPYQDNFTAIIICYE